MNTLINKINELLSEKDCLIISIDGRCAAGKTTFADILQKKIDCNVFHGDDFFLRPEQRTQERMSQAGENIDYERLISEVIIPLKNGEIFSYRPFDCHTMDFKSEINAAPKKINIIEGAYCCNKHLYDYADIHVFMDIDTETQRKRIIDRNGENAELFFTKWIPMEEKYFKSFNIKNKCEIKI